MDSSRVIPISALVLLALSGCGSGEPMTEDMGGTARLQFMVTNTVRQSRNLTDPLLGNIYGAIFIAEEVTITGPIEGAQDLNAGGELDGVDLRTAETSTATWETIRLPPNDYIWLGFYDVDGNGAETRDPDSGDPVTLPTNAFTIRDGRSTPHVVTFDLVFN